MEKNILIEFQKDATELLKRNNKAAQVISENEAQVYVIYDLFTRKPSNKKTFVVWAVKTGKLNYDGILIKSGARHFPGEPFSFAVHVNFTEGDIVSHKKPGDFLSAYLQLTKDAEGNLLIKKTVSLPFASEIESLLTELYPETAGLSIVLISSAPNKKTAMLSSYYWAKKHGNVFKAINICSKKNKVFHHSRVFVIAPGRRINSHYVLWKGRRGLKIWFSK